MDSAPSVLPPDRREASQMLCRPPEAPLPPFRAVPDRSGGLIASPLTARLQPASSFHLSCVLWLPEVAGMTCEPITALNQFYSCFPTSRLFPWELMTWENRSYFLNIDPSWLKHLREQATVPCDTNYQLGRSGLLGSLTILILMKTRRVSVSVHCSQVSKV